MQSLALGEWTGCSSSRPDQQRRARPSDASTSMLAPFAGLRDPASTGGSPTTAWARENRRLMALISGAAGCPQDQQRTRGVRALPQCLAMRHSALRRALVLLVAKRKSQADVALDYRFNPIASKIASSPRASTTSLSAQGRARATKPVRPAWPATRARSRQDKFAERHDLQTPRPLGRLTRSGKLQAAPVPGPTDCRSVRVHRVGAQGGRRLSHACAASAGERVRASS
jgi:hypothetical protein